MIEAICGAADVPTDEFGRNSPPLTTAASRCTLAAQEVEHERKDIFMEGIRRDHAGRGDGLYNRGYGTVCR